MAIAYQEGHSAAVKPRGSGWIVGYIVLATLKIAASLYFGQDTLDSSQLIGP